MPPVLFHDSTFNRKPGRRNTVLNEQIAVEIYSHKLRLITPTSFKSCFEPAKAKIRGESTRLCRHYGVSSKTIRDIWNRRSWAEATTHLWTAEGNTAEAIVDYTVLL